MKQIDYIFNEDELITEIREYINSTYSQHYASNKIQVTEFIDAHCDSPDFFRGCAMKYLARYGHKEGYNRKDLLKAVHYLVMMIDWHDRNRKLKSPGISVTEIDESPPLPKIRGEVPRPKADVEAEKEKWDRLAPKHYGDKKVVTESCKECNGAGYIHIETSLGKLLCEECKGRGYVV